MIATFDRTARNVRRGSAAGVMLSLTVAAVALTGAVRGQEGPGTKGGATEPAATPARAVQPAGAPQPAEAKSAPFTKEDAEKLWRDKYAERIITVKGREVNREQVDSDFLEEVAGRVGSGKDARALLGLDRDPQGRPPKYPAAPALRTPEGAAKLWNEKFTEKLVFVNGHIVNQDQVTEQFVHEVERLTGSGAVGFRARDNIMVGENGKASPRPPAPAEPRTAAPEPPNGDAETAEDRETAALLARKIPELNFDAVAFADVVDFLRDVGGANVFVEWGALESAGIDKTSQVSIRLRNVTFAQAMELILASASKGKAPLGYGIKGGVVRISTGEDLDKDTEIRAYDVRDIVPAEMEMKELAALIKESVEPDSWRDNGGTTGSVHTSKHKMIVSTTEATHRRIRSVLEMLRDEPRQARTDAPDSTAQAPRGGRQ